MVREGTISATLATSLMNDQTYAREVSDKLLDMASVLFSTGDLESRAASRSVALEEDEMTEALESTAPNYKVT